MHLHCTLASPRRLPIETGLLPFAVPDGGRLVPNRSVAELEAIPPQPVGPVMMLLPTQARSLGEGLPTSHPSLKTTGCPGLLNDYWKWITQQISYHHALPLHLPQSCSNIHAGGKIRSTLLPQQRTTFALFVPSNQTC